MISATSISLFKNLSQYDYGGHYHDFHNDYSCEKLSYNNETLLILFKSLIGGILLSLKFTGVKMKTFNFFNTAEVKSLTLDNLYRGRAELNGDLIEVSKDGSGYFYLEFYEGQKLEFWAKGVDIEQL